MSIKFIEFESGGTLSVEMNANLFALTTRDRKLYGAVADLLLQWEMEHGQVSSSNSGTEGGDEKRA